jgi:hypothetical protein
MTTILVIISHISVYGAGVTVATQEFSSVENCQAAQAVIQSDVHAKEYIESFCVRK